MRTMNSLRVGSTLVACALALTAAVAARADVSTERPGSILIFPKVIADGTRDTIIQISNISTMTVHAHCFYVDGSRDPNTLQPRWQETDFNIWLTRLQPTHWRVSAGRPVDFTDSDEGLDPGAVPPATAGFQGELLCVQVDSGAPSAGNSLIGDATLKNLQSGDVSKYNGLAIKAVNGSDDDLLLLNDTVATEGDDSAEYNGCPRALQFAGVRDLDEDPVLGAGSESRSFMTLIPCSADFENLVPASVSVSVNRIDEFETQLSFAGALNVTCWRELALGGSGSVFGSYFSGAPTQFYTATLTPNSQVGLLGVFDTVVTDSNSNSATAAINMSQLGADKASNLPATGPAGPPASIRISGE
jgi:hypothetical protein